MIALPILVARGVSVTSHNLKNALTSGSCGCAVKGSHKKITTSKS